MSKVISFPVPYLFDFFFEYDRNGTNYGPFTYRYDGHCTRLSVSFWWGHARLDFDADPRCKPICWLVSKIPYRDEPIILT